MKLKREKGKEVNSGRKYYLRNRDRLKPPPRLKYTVLAIHEEPNLFNEAITSGEAKQWHHAMREEIQDLKESGYMEIGSMT